MTVSLAIIRICNIHVLLTSTEIYEHEPPSSIVPYRIKYATEGKAKLKLLSGLFSVK